MSFEWDHTLDDQELIVRHQDVLGDGRTLTMYYARSCEPGRMQGTCFCGMPITMERAQEWFGATIAHDELVIASTSAALLMNWDKSGPSAELDLVYQVCRGRDEWAGLAE